MRSLRGILASVRKGSLPIEDAVKMLRLDAIAVVDDVARIDVNRYLRRDVPEVIYCASKSKEQIIAIVKKLISERKKMGLWAPIVLSKLNEEQLSTIPESIESSGALRVTRFAIEVYENANMIVVTKKKRSQQGRIGSGRVALVSAGTSDITALNETEIILRLLGCGTIRFNDVGVGALHRLTKPLKAIFDYDPDVIVVAAGMEGALPSVIAGLSDVPVIGLPTSVGYGYGKNGEAALMSMLQACPLGMCVVNIDGGIAAGIVASLISKRKKR